MNQPPVARRILVTGGAGFIGSPLAITLAERGHDVVVLDKLSPQVHGPKPGASSRFTALNARVKFIQGDVTSRIDLERALADVDTVVHLAAETGTGQSMYAIGHYSDTNVVGTSLLLDLIVNNSLPVRRLVVASSRAVYGEGKYSCSLHGVNYPGPREAKAILAHCFEHYCPICAAPMTPLPTPEEARLHPNSVYGVTKLTQEQLVLSVGRALGISAIAFRYQNVYGPGQSLQNPYTGILSIFSTRMRLDRHVNIFEDGLETRDFVYIDDVVDATVRGIEHPASVVEVMNVGSGLSTPVATVAHTIKRHLGSSSELIISGQSRAGDIRHNFADISKVATTLGWSPQTSIEEGLQFFTEWVRTEPLPHDRYEDSLKELRARGLFL
jgi:dTDP-L-rhamnose 4-epimerase